MKTSYILIQYYFWIFILKDYFFRVVYNIAMIEEYITEELL